MTACGAYPSGEIELYFYDELEPIERARVEGHLPGCAACRGVLEDLALIRASLAARPQVAAPPGGDWSRFMTRLDAAVAAGRAQSTTVPFAARADGPPAGARASVAGYLAMAALLALVTASVVFVARSGDAVAPAAAPETAAVAPPAAARTGADLATFGGRHLQRSKLVVLGMATKDAGGEAAWDYERELAAGLLNDTRLYRLTAEERGLTRLAAVLRDLEIVLLQTSLTDDDDPDALAQIQRLIRKRDLLEQMELVGTEGN